VLAVKEGQLLLVRRAIEPYYGYWDIPGGFLEAGEHPEAGAIREMEEETGLVIEPVEILGLYMSTYGPAGEPTLNICYVATSYISLNVRSFFSAKARLMLRRTSKQQDAAIGRKFALKSRYFWYINNRIQAIGALPPGLAELQGRI
jgi:ADP-ribose pyrophosphatase YjhB (NUDIX family)